MKRVPGSKGEAAIRSDPRGGPGCAAQAPDPPVTPGPSDGSTPAETAPPLRTRLRPRPWISRAVIRLGMLRLLPLLSAPLAFAQPAAAATEVPVQPLGSGWSTSGRWA